MARKVLTVVRGVPLIITLNETIVGKGGDNRRRSDIQLVQFFLRQFFNEHPERFAKLPKTRINASNGFTIDGVCGRQTEAGIVDFQRFLVARGFRTQPVDGLVNVATSKVSRITNSQYTIFTLNLFFNAFGDMPEFLQNLENHPDVIQSAPELQAELAVARVEEQIK